MCDLCDGKVTIRQDEDTCVWMNRLPFDLPTLVIKEENETARMYVKYCPLCGEEIE